MIALRRRFILGRCLAVAGLTLAVCLAVAADPPTGNAPPALDDRHDLVFLAEARPVLIRMHVQLDGKPVQAVLDDFMQHLFTYLDLDGDHVLSTEEAERAPPVDQILTGGLGRAFGGLGGIGGKTPAAPTMADLDTDKDGRVTLAELSAYYRKHGLAPLQLQPDSGNANPLAGAGFLGGAGPNPPWTRSPKRSSYCSTPTRTAS